MEDGNAPTKTLPDLSDELLGQGDLRNEEERAFFLTHGIAGRSEIDLGFPAPGHTVQQKNVKFSLFQGIFHLALRVLLGGCQRERVPLDLLAVVPGIISTLFSVSTYLGYRLRGFSDSPGPGERLHQTNQVQRFEVLKRVSRGQPRETALQGLKARSFLFCDVCQ